MKLYNLVYTVGERKVVTVLYARNEVHLIQQVKSSYPGQKVKVLASVLMSRGAL